MQFSQFAPNSPLYYSSDFSSISQATLYYLLPKNVSSPLTSITFADSWSANSGAYFFFAQPLPSTSIAAFITAGQNFIGTSGRIRFVFANPYTSGSVSGTAISVNVQGSGSSAVYTVAFLVTFGFRNVTVGMAPNTTITQGSDNFSFANPPSPTPSIFMTANSGKARITSLGTSLNIPFSVPNSGSNACGCLQFQVTVSTQNLTDLDIGLRFFYISPLNPKQPNEPGNFVLNSMRFPIFSAGMVLNANLDPLNPVVASRTFFSFASTDPIGSYYNTTLGYAVSLAPQASAALIFATNQKGSSPGSQDLYYLTPSGLFDVSVPNQSGNPLLMGGLSGVEFVALTSPTAVLNFVPGQSAFAAGFFPGQPPGWTTLSPAQSPTTSYVSLGASAQASSNLQYYAQPDQSVLYNYGTFPSKPTIPVLGPVPVEASTLTWSPGGSSTVFPWVPYAGTGPLAATIPDPNGNPYDQIESQFISPARRAALTNLPALPSTLPGPTCKSPSVTPQGLLVYYTEGETQWDQVVLAQMPNQQVFGLGMETPCGKPQPGQGNPVSGQLLQAFQSNKMFLVVSEASSIQNFLPTTLDQISIAGGQNETWNFDIDPNGWQRSNDDISKNTILIVKYSDLSIQDLAGQPNTCWASPATFNQSPSAVSAAILDIINNAVLAYNGGSGDTDFANFVNAVTSPTWNGVLILNAAAPLNELPAQLEGLAAGINPKAFYAHHVGINAAQINYVASPGPLGIQNSNIFGLINYVGPALTASSSQDYQFSVETLKVLFTNSTVAGFSSLIDLQINKLFGEPCKLQGSDNNVVKMYGVYQKHTVNGVEQDSYSFQTASGVSSVFGMSSNFKMTSSVLNRVQLSQGQFVTITAKQKNSSKGPSEPTKSQFTFWGLIDFLAIQGFDVFSFGSEDPTSVKVDGLNFSKLSVDMSFTPGGPPAAFTFDASDIAFDLANSHNRDTSFFKHFPLTLASFTQAKEGVTPTGLGFMGVQTPLNQSLLTYPWFSLNFNLNLGTPGALVAQVGFVATLTAAWSPNANQYVVFTGLRLPGSSGSKREISIEGIFNITFKTLEIMVVSQTSYILVLYAIAFKFLSFSFPPKGQVNFVIFGNPGQTTGTEANLGWYAAYAKSGGGGGGDSAKPKLLALPPQPAALLDMPEGIENRPEGGVQ